MVSKTSQRSLVLVTSRHYKWEVITYDFDFSCEYSSVFTPLPRSSIDERFSNQVPQATASIEEVSETDTINVDELIELAATVEGRPSTPSTGSELPPSSDAYTPRLEEVKHIPERCWCQREVCHRNYRPRTPPTPPGIMLWKPGSLNLPSQS